MQGFMITLLICSVTMSASALLYMAITPLLAKRYSVNSRYYAWLIIVLGFIIPFRPHFDNPMVKVDIPSQTFFPVVQIGNDTPFVLPAQDTPLPTVLPSISLWQIAVIVWLVGMLAVFAYHAIKHYSFMKMVRRWSETVVDEQVMALVQDLTSELRINRQIDLKVCPCIGSPMLVGFIKPQILIPQLNFANDELRFILKHELVHFKRKDLWYKCSVLLATAMHWFNPIVYLMAKAINVQCELSCDAEVVKSTNQDTRLHYSETIIGVIQYHSKLNTALSTNFYGGKKGMKKRIFCIMDTGKKKAGFAIICGALIVTLGTGVAFAANASAATPQSNRNNSVSVTAGDNAQRFAKYEKYGLTYNKATDRLYYNGTLVRYFEDYYPIDGNSSAGYDYFNVDGKIDVHGVRDLSNITLNPDGSTDPSGKLIGVEPYSQAEFDARTAELKNPTLGSTATGTIEYNVGASASFSGSGTAKEISTQDLAQVYAPYKKIGITYDQKTDNLYYNDKLIRFFQDDNMVVNSDGTGNGSIVSHYPNQNGGEIDVYAVRGVNRELTGVTVASQADFNARTAILKEQNNPNLNYAVSNR